MDRSGTADLVARRVLRIAARPRVPGQSILPVGADVVRNMQPVLYGSSPGGPRCRGVISHHSTSVRLPRPGCAFVRNNFAIYLTLEGVLVQTGHSGRGDDGKRPMFTAQNDPGRDRQPTAALVTAGRAAGGRWRVGPCPTAHCGLRGFGDEFDLTAAPRPNRCRRIACHATSIHRNDHRWLMPVASRVLIENPDVDFEVVAEGSLAARL
jgi:hypothetical protein